MSHAGSPLDPPHDNHGGLQDLLVDTHMDVLMVIMGTENIPYRL